MATLSRAISVKESIRTRYLAPALRADVVARRAVLDVGAAVRRAPSNIHAVGVGRKVSDGRTTKTICVRIHVVQKLPESLLPAAERIPAEIDGVPTDVVESAPASITARPVAPACTTRRRRRQRPILAGISAGHFAITAGTLGCFCRSTRVGDDPEALFALSNNHVFADVDRAAVGDNLVQPGTADGGRNPADRFATLARAVPIALGGTTPNRVDAAIGLIGPTFQVTNEVCTIGAILGTVAPTEEMAVRKHGRTTGLTYGRVTDVSYDALVGMDHADPTVIALFEDQVRIEGAAPTPVFGLGGDSGSLVVGRRNRRAVALYFAGPESGLYGIASPIREVTRLLEIRIP